MMRLAELEQAQQQQEVDHPEVVQPDAAQEALATTTPAAAIPEDSQEQGPVLTNGNGIAGKVHAEEEAVLSGEDSLGTETTTEEMFTTVYHSSEPCCTGELILSLEWWSFFRMMGALRVSNVRAGYLRKV